MNRHERRKAGHQERALRKELRRNARLSPQHMIPGGVKRRHELWKAVVDHVGLFSEGLGPDFAIVVADTRDPIAREWIKTVFDVDDAQVDVMPGIEHAGASCTIFATATEMAITLAAINNPGISERIETLPEDTRPVLVVSEAGTLLATVQDEGAHGEGVAS